MKHSNSFDHDLAFGEETEDWVKMLFGDEFKVEVKTDRIADKTKNAFIELYSRGKPSGLSTTKADYWIYKIQKTGLCLIIPVHFLKELCKRIYNRNGKTLKRGGDNNTSEGILIPFNDFIN